MGLHNSLSLSVWCMHNTLVQCGLNVHSELTHAANIHFVSKRWYSRYVFCLWWIKAVLCQSRLLGTPNSQPNITSTYHGMKECHTANMTDMGLLSQRHTHLHYRDVTVCGPIVIRHITSVDTGFLSLIYTYVQDRTATDCLAEHLYIWFLFCM